ncbi:MAG TPA: SRPBCC family protein [Myxococcaceae bacterium]
MLKKVLLGILGLLVLAIGAAFLMPSRWHVEKSVMVKAKPEVLYASVADLKQWGNWAGWNNAADPTVKWDFSGAAMGQGAVMSWKGEKMGSGTITLVKADPQTGVMYEMKMEEMQTPSTGVIALVPDGDDTRVTWTNDGDFGAFLPGRYFVGFMEKSLGQHFEEGLNRLKANAEKAQ